MSNRATVTHYAAFYRQRRDRILARIKAADAAHDDDAAMAHLAECQRYVSWYIGQLERQSEAEYAS